MDNTNKHENENIEPEEEQLPFDPTHFQDIETNSEISDIDEEEEEMIKTIPRKIKRCLQNHFRKYLNRLHTI